MDILFQIKYLNKAIDYTAQLINSEDPVAEYPHYRKFMLEYAQTALQTHRQYQIEQLLKSTKALLNPLMNWWTTRYQVSRIHNVCNQILDILNQERNELKDATVFQLIHILTQHLDFSCVELVDHWPADLCAIGIKKGEKQVFISTYGMVNNVSGGYDYDLEQLNEGNYKVVKNMRSATEATLLEDIRQFLD